jgi:aspartyl-tRNA(Asn)/glutamyl-tRNA(Gln) amidotransferase subunit A
VVGRTNMTEFAFSGVGINPHHGTPANPCDPPGAAHSRWLVVRRRGFGREWLGLHRPGFRHRRLAAHSRRPVRHRRLQEHGAAGACRRRISAVHHAGHRLCHDAQRARHAARPRDPGGASVRRDASRWRATASPWPPRRCWTGSSRPWRGPSSARCRGCVPPAPASRRSRCPRLHDLGTIQATGGFSAAESYAWHRLLLERSGAQLRPARAQRILRGADHEGLKYIDLHQARRLDRPRRSQAWRLRRRAVAYRAHHRAVHRQPGTGRRARRSEFFRVNALLLRNTSVVNMLDGCAISLPCHAAGELPVGLMLWHGALRDDTLLNGALPNRASPARRRPANTGGAGHLL